MDNDCVLISAFRNGRASVLVATDVAARGLGTFFFPYITDELLLLLPTLC